MKFDRHQQHLDFLRSHVWAALATGRTDGSSQQSGMTEPAVFARLRLGLIAVPLMTGLGWMTPSTEVSTAACSA